jgi:hypothetical protein
MARYSKTVSPYTVPIQFESHYIANVSIVWSTNLTIWPPVHTPSLFSLCQLETIFPGQSYTHLGTELANIHLYGTK